MKRIYVKDNVLKEAVDYLNDDITFFGFLSNTKAFLKELLVNPLNADIDDYLKRHGMDRKTLLDALMGRGIVEKETKIVDENGTDKFSVSYKVPKRNFERKMRRVYASLFEKYEIKESRLYENESFDTVGGSPVALSYLLEGGPETIESTGYLLHAISAAFELITNKIESIRNKYLQQIDPNPANFINDRTGALQEIKTVIETTYGQQGLNILNDILNNATGFYAREGKKIESRLMELNTILKKRRRVTESNNLATESNQLLAPNGKVSKLPENLWKLVRTPQFKQWFGDWENNPAQSSKVVDENGEPLVMIHNTKEVFDVFDVERGIDKMAYFADAHGTNYVGGFERGNVNMYVFLNMRKPCDDIENGPYAKEEGFDGILVRGEIDGKIGTYAAVYNSNQIKSIDNKGMFTNDNNNIYETDCGGAMQGGGLNPSAGQYDVKFGNTQRRKIHNGIQKTPINDSKIRRKIYVTEEQAKMLQEMGTQDAGDYQYDVPFGFNNGNDPAYDHSNMMAKSFPGKKKKGKK